jgi:hypothetical protein
VETLRPESNRWRDTLIIDDHYVDDARHYRQFLTRKICDDRNTSTHQQFISSATDANDINPLRTSGYSLTLQLVSRIADHLAQNGIVPVHTDVYKVPL